jgi:cytolysin-activating lysine-acyltransferase
MKEARSDESEKFRDLGRLTWLWMNSPLHEDWPMNVASRSLLPPLQLDQYMIEERKGMPVAYCSWAFLNQDAEFRYIQNPSALSAADWNAGERLWIMDWVAPFSKTDSWTMRGRLLKRFPHELARALRVKRNGCDVARILSFKGRQMKTEHARNLRARYQSESLNMLYRLS